MVFNRILKKIRKSFGRKQPPPDLNVEYFRMLGAHISDDVELIGPVSPVLFSSEPYLVSIGSHTTISFDVVFVTHDAATRVIRHLPNGDPETVIYGSITVGDNCFIGCRSVILPNVKIGRNCIIGAGSVVNRDIPDNSVAAGNPCRVICSLDEYRNKHAKDFLYMVSLPYQEKRAYLEKHFNMQ